MGKYVKVSIHFVRLLTKKSRSNKMNKACKEGEIWKKKLYIK